jgi:hypothetical protein
MGNKKFIFWLCLFSSSSIAREAYLRKDQSISQLLYENNLKPIYGEGNYLDRVLKLNKLTLLEARRLPVNFKVILSKDEEGEESNQLTEHEVKYDPPIPSVQEEKLESDLRLNFSLGTNFYKFIDNKNNAARLDSSYFKMGPSISSPIMKNIYIQGLFQVHYHHFSKPELVKVSKRSFLTYGFEVGPRLNVNTTNYVLSYGQEPWFAPVKKSLNSLTLTQVPVHYLKPSIGTKIGSLETQLYFKYYVPRKSSDLNLKGGTSYGANIWVHSRIKQKDFTWGLEGYLGSRKTNLNEETISGFGLNLKY